MNRLASIVAVVLLTTVGACKSGTPTAPTPPPVVVTPPPPAAPTVSCPSPISISTTGTSTTVSYTTPEADGGQQPVTVTCTPPSGSSFPVGATEVSCTATDSLNRSASCVIPVAVARTPTLSRTKFLAFGDSITVGWTSAENPSPSASSPYILSVLTTEAYPSVLQSLLAARFTAQQTVVINEGKGGERAQDALGRASLAFGFHRPEVVLIMMGYNDLAEGDSGIERGIRAVNDLVKEARFRGARVLLATLTPSPIGVFRGLGNTNISRFNEGLKAVARGENVPLVDVNAAWAHDPNRYNSADGRHPNALGYRLIAETFMTAIRNEFENR
jgi:lysophospholipase L1-like esterase